MGRSKKERLAKIRRKAARAQDYYMKATQFAIEFVVNGDRATASVEALPREGHARMIAVVSEKGDKAYDKVVARLAPIIEAAKACEVDCNISMEGVL